MGRLVTLLALGLALAATSRAQAQVLSTLPSNNGTGGNFFQLSPTAPILFNAFTTQFGGAAGTPASIEVYTRPGPYAGFTASNVGWNLLGTVTGLAAGTTTNSPPINLPAPFFINAASTQSFYIHSVTTGNGIRYQGTGTTATTTFMNADLTLFSDTSRTGAVAFAGTQFSPRAFSGSILYSIVPEPASFFTLGLAGIGLAIRRNRSAKA